jgi:hypothetical protein
MDMAQRELKPEVIEAFIMMVMMIGMCFEVNKRN